jgi:hypothetical protein
LTLRIGESNEIGHVPKLVRRGRAPSRVEARWIPVGANWQPKNKKPRPEPGGGRGWGWGFDLRDDAAYATLILATVDPTRG